MATVHVSMGKHNLTLRIATHQEISHQALYHTLPSISQYTKNNEPFIYAGSFFPDWGYSCGNANSEAELAHWPLFWSTAVQYLHSYKQPFTEDLVSLIAFLFGVVSHDVADVLWHSLNINQGFIESMQYMNIINEYNNAHGNADVGGDLLVMRFGDSGYLTEWKVPAGHLVNIYGMLNRSVSIAQIEKCMSLGYIGLVAERNLGKYLFPNYASRSPFLVQQYYEYFRGGINSIAIAVSECWLRSLQWYQTGKMTRCGHMGTYYDLPSTKSLKNAKRTTKMQECILKRSRVDVSTSLSYSSISPSSVSESTLHLCLLSTIQIEKPSPNLFNHWIVKSSLNFIYAGFEYLYRTVHDCDELSGTSLYISQDYSKLGKSVVVGDFGKGLEVVFGASGYSSNGFLRNGAVFIVNPSSIPPKDRVEVDSISNIIKGPNENGAEFGYAMTIVDLNFDGVDDLVVSAPMSGFSNETQSGKIFVLFGRKGRGVRIDEFDLIIDGNVGRKSGFDTMVLGTEVVGVDVDFDGFKDLVVGSSRATLKSYLPQHGAVGVFLAKSGFVGNVSYENSDWKLEGTQAYERFGSSVSVDGTFMYVGSPGYNNQYAENSQGSVSQYLLSANGPVFVKRMVGDYPMGQFGSNLKVSKDKSLVVASVSEATKSPAAVAMNLPGLLVNDNGYQGGVVRVYSNNSNSGALAIHGSGSLGYFGNAVEVLDDGILISEPLSYGERGNVYLIPNTALKPFGDLKIRSIAKKCWKGKFHEQLGTTLKAVDLNHNGKLDLVIVSENDPFSDFSWSSGRQAGKIQIIWDAL